MRVRLRGDEDGARERFAGSPPRALVLMRWAGLRDSQSELTSKGAASARGERVGVRRERNAKLCAGGGSARFSRDCASLRGAERTRGQMASAVASTSALPIPAARPLRPRPAASSSRKKRVALSPSPSGSEYADSHDDAHDSDDSGAGEPEQLDDDTSEHSDSNSDSGGDGDASDDDDDDELLQGDGTDHGRRRRRKEKSGKRRKKYPCTWPGCGKVYARPTRLDEHARGHTGEVRPLSCYVDSPELTPPSTAPVSVPRLRRLLRSRLAPQGAPSLAPERLGEAVRLRRTRL